MQFAHSAEHIFVRLLLVLSSERIDDSANVTLRQDRSGNAMTFGPQCPQNNGIVEFVSWGWRNKPRLSLSKPLLPAGLRLARRRSWREEKPFAGSGLSHFAVEL